MVRGPVVVVVVTVVDVVIAAVAVALAIAIGLGTVAVAMVVDDVAIETVAIAKRKGNSDSLTMIVRL